MNIIRKAARKMTKQDSWIIKIGGTVLIIGIALMTISLLYHIQLGYHSPGWSFDWNDHQVQLLTYRIMGLLGLFLLIIGAIFYTMGMRSLYFKPLKQLLYPPLPREDQNKSPSSYNPENTYACAGCKRLIPYGVAACPHCGVKQLGNVGVGLKDV
jgi:hypothetical protein